MFLFGLQHVMSMYAGVVAVPFIVGTALGLSFADLSYLLAATLLVSGLATLLQTLGVKWIGARLPIVQGTSFAAVASMIAVGTRRRRRRRPAGDLRRGPGRRAVGFLLSGVFARLLHFFPPVVTGSVITVIGISLLPVAMRWAGGGGRPRRLRLDLERRARRAHPVIILVIYRFLPGFFSRIAILVGLVVGAWSPRRWARRTSAGRTGASGSPSPRRSTSAPPPFPVAAIISMTIVMLVIMAETTADILAIGEVVDRPADRRTVARPARRLPVHRGVRRPAQRASRPARSRRTSGWSRITGIKSRFVVAASGGILVVLGLFPKVGAIVAAMPLPVLGGAGLALFATVAASGIRALSRVHYEGNNNLVIVALSIGMGVIPIAVPDFYEHFPSWFQTIFDSGISSAAVTAVLLNILFNVGRREPKEAAIFAESPTIGVTPEYDVPGGLAERARHGDPTTRARHRGHDVGTPSPGRPRVLEHRDELSPHEAEDRRASQTEH